MFLARVSPRAIPPLEKRKWPALRKCSVGHTLSNHVSGSEIEKELSSLTCIESALTGESEAVAKQTAALLETDIPLGDRSNLVFMGTSVATGTAQAVVVATAMKTELGHIAGLSETKPVWRISLATNVQLVIVVVISFGVQVWSQHNATLGSFLKTTSMPLSDCLLLLALGALPLIVLEMVKVVRRRRAAPAH